jgi:hypothetical protein
MPRLIEPSDIPTSLWDPNHAPTAECPKAGCLKLPKTFSDAYKALLHELLLIDRAEVAETNTEGGATGDNGDGGFEEHFARRFSGSAARVQLYSLDPRNTFSTTSDALFALFAGGTVRLLDIPIGAGAASAVLLSVVAELRLSNILPSYPTNVKVFGGDVDKKALRAAGKLFRALEADWTKAGLSVVLNPVDWDASDDESSIALIEHWRAGHQSHERCATIVANFSGYLCNYLTDIQRRRFEERDFMIRQVVLAANRLSAPLFWIEPNRKHVPAMFNWVSQKIVSKYKGILQMYSGHRHELSTTESPLSNTVHFTTRAMGVHWNIAKQ